MRLYLITHAHTQVEPERDARHWALSAAGQRQAEALAERPFWDSVDAIALSTEPKTRLTVGPVLAQRDLPLLVDPRFDELRRSRVPTAKAYRARVEQAFAHPDQPAGDWEAANVARARFSAGLLALAERHPDGVLALVGHGLTLSLFRAEILKRPRVSMNDWQGLSFAAVAELEIPLVKPESGVRGTIVRDFEAVGEQMDRG